MDCKAKIMQLLDDVPEHMMKNILTYIQGIISEEEYDDAFCQKMLEEYNNSSAEDKEGVPFEECLKEWKI